MYPWFPTVEDYAQMVYDMGWDSSHIRIRDAYGIDAANKLDMRYLQYIKGEIL